jgi:hypothetical protein
MNAWAQGRRWRSDHGTMPTEYLIGGVAYASSG